MSTPTALGGDWEGHVPKTSEFRRLLLGLFFAGVATFAQLYSPQGLLPLIATDLNITPDQAALIVSASTMGMAVSVIPWSFVGDSLGRRKAMAISVILACIFALAAVLAPNYSWMLAFRTLEGMCLGGVPALAMAYLNEEVNTKYAGQTAGTFIAGTVVGGLLGRVVATPMADLTHWRLGMLLVVILSVGCAVAFILISPKARRFLPSGTSPRQAIRSITDNLRSFVLIVMYMQGMLLMGSFIAVYNYLGFHLMDEPFNLPVSVVSMLFLTYLMGTWSSPIAGKLAGQYGPSRVLIVCTGLMALAMLLTLSNSLILIVGALLVFTGAFFGAHSVASGWAGSAARGGRAQSTSLYNLFYYSGSSIFGWLGGIFLHHYGWPGTVWMTLGLISLALVLVTIIYFKIVLPRQRATKA